MQYRVYCWNVLKTFTYNYDLSPTKIQNSVLYCNLAETVWDLTTFISRYLYLELIYNFEDSTFCLNPPVLLVTDRCEGVFHITMKTRELPMDEKKLREDGHSIKWLHKHLECADEERKTLNGWTADNRTIVRAVNKKLKTTVNCESDVCQKRKRKMQMLCCT